MLRNRYGLVYTAVYADDYSTLPAVYYDVGQQLCVLLEPTTCRRYAKTLGMLYTADDDCPSSVSDWLNSVLLSGLLNGMPAAVFALHSCCCTIPGVLC